VAFNEEDVASFAFIPSFLHSFIPSFIHSFIRSYTYIMTADTAPTALDAPKDANVGCVGPTAEEAGKSSACDGCPNQGACSSGSFNSPEAIAKAEQETNALQHSLSNVSHVILVLSGKGGVGKSTVAAQLTHTLASQGYAVGLLDVDLCGPSAPRMVLGDAYQTATVTKSASGAWIPVYSNTHPNLACMSISFLLQDHDSAVVWRGTKGRRVLCLELFVLSKQQEEKKILTLSVSRCIGPRKNGLIQQFLTEVDWTGDTDGLGTCMAVVVVVLSSSPEFVVVFICGASQPVNSYCCCCCCHT
jgi:hypothetical protein